MFAHVLSNGISWHAQPALAASAQSGLTLGIYLQPMLTAGLADDRPPETVGSQPQPGATPQPVVPQLVATLFIADRDQLEGALALANAGLPLTEQIQLTGTDGSRHRDQASRLSKATRWGRWRVPAGTCSRSASRTATWPIYCWRGRRSTCPTGQRRSTAALYRVQDGDTLSSIAAGLLSPFERLTREALLWAAESAQLSVQQARAALAGQVTAPTAPGPDTLVTASHLHALYVDLTDPDMPFRLSQVIDFLNSHGVTLDLRSMSPPQPQYRSFTVFPMLPFVQLTADGATVDFGTGPFQVTSDYSRYLAQYFQELAAPSPSSPGTAGAAPAGTAQPTAAGNGQRESVAALLFTDYFVFILRQLVQDALDLYREYPYQAGTSDTLADIAVQLGIGHQGRPRPP